MHVADLKGCRAGRPGLVLGNGPSAGLLDVVRCKVEIVGMHRTWRPPCNVTAPRFHVILQQRAYWQEIRRHDWRPDPHTTIVTKDVYGQDGIPFSDPAHPARIWPRTCFVRVLPTDHHRFSLELNRGTYSNHAGSFALELAHWVGYDPIYLLGIDLGDRDGHFCDDERTNVNTRKLQRSIFASAARYLPEGRVVNLNPESTVRDFPFGELEEALY